MRFTDIFIKRPVLALVVSLLILLIGLKAMLGLQIRQYPRLFNTTITVTTAYPGASPDLIQGFITTPIEQAVATAEGIDYLTSNSIQGTSTVTAYIRLNYDPSQAMTDVMAKVQQVKYLIPNQAQDPIILKSTGQTTAVMYVGFSSADLSSAGISDFLTRVVQPLMSTVDGVASADILGGQTFAMRLWLDPARMAASGISANDVALAIRANNYQSAPGQAKGFYTVTNVEAGTGLVDVDQFKRMVVKSSKEALVRLEDIATVDLGAQSWTSSVAMNGQHAVFIGIQATPTANPLSIVAGIRGLLPEIQRNLPPSVKMQIAYDSTRFIQASIDEVQMTLGQAVVIVVVVIFLFLGSFRAVLIPIVTIPLSLVGAGIIDNTFSRLAQWYGTRLEHSLDYRPVTALFAAAVFVALGFMYLNTSKELAPEEDQGVLFALTKGPQYANLDYLDSYGEELDKAFTSIPEAELRFVVNGRFGPNQGIAGVILKPWGERGRSAQQIKTVLQQKVSAVEGMNAFAFSLPPLPASIGGLPVQMVIDSTGDFVPIYQAMEQIKAAARKSGLFIVTDSDLAFNQPTIRVDIDRDKANELGITMQAIGDTLALLVGENYVNRFNLGGRSYEVIPQVPRTGRLSQDTLTQYYVTSAAGQPVPLSNLVKVSTKTAPNALTRYNQLNSATFQAVPMPGVTMGQAVDFLEQEAKKLPSGFSHDYLSDARQYVQEGNQLLVTFVFALVVIFLVLAAQFESLRDPLVILVSVPMSICGAMMPLFIGLATINIYTQVGLVTLIGLISKHGILMVEFANQLQVTEGLNRRRAIERAARVRLRPILMTTAAMVVGLVPLLTASGAGAASRFSIGVVVVAGMSIGTLFTLFVLPAVYTVLAMDHAAAAHSVRAKERAQGS